MCHIFRKDAFCSFTVLFLPFFSQRMKVYFASCCTSFFGLFFYSLLRLVYGRVNWFFFVSFSKEFEMWRVRSFPITGPEIRHRAFRHLINRNGDFFDDLEILKCDVSCVDAPLINATGLRPWNRPETKIFF